MFYDEEFFSPPFDRTPAPEVETEGLQNFEQAKSGKSYWRKKGSKTISIFLNKNNRWQWCFATPRVKVYSQEEYTTPQAAAAEIKTLVEQGIHIDF